MMIVMTAAEINALNAAYEAAQAANPDESTHILTYDVAVAANLTHVRRDDESGNIWRNAEGRHVYGWNSGGFDEQIEDEPMPSDEFMEALAEEVLSRPVFAGDYGYYGE